ncbi:MAG: OsmC family protein [Clostridia bacterium]|nr:OsmC family protein [Deltaproteobacteria bacterium]
MSVRVDIRYDGSLRCAAIHEPSNTTLTTDAPRDNKGLGNSFSPTDLVATALGTCILTTMAISANNRGEALDGASAIVHKEMVTDPKRRIGKLTVAITMPAALSQASRERYEHIAHTCPVTQSLSDRTELVMTFSYA